MAQLKSVLAGEIYYRMHLGEIRADFLYDRMPLPTAFQDVIIADKFTNQGSRNSTIVACFSGRPVVRQRMTESAQERWNRRYDTQSQEWLESSPRKLLLDHRDLLPEKGIALDAACGVAANGIYLAQAGLRVIGLDISERALQLARRSAAARSVHLDVCVYDLSNPWLPDDYFDVILNFRFLERAALPRYRQALKPGGLLFFEAFGRVASQSELDYPKHYLEPGELISHFDRWQVLFHMSSQRSRRRSGRLRAVEQLIACKTV